MNQQAELCSSVVSLCEHMPGMAFAKDSDTGVYLTCNQAFADYAHRPTPDEVVGLTDFDIFEREIAEHFVTDDKMALGMSEPYVFIEDVADAKGTPRHFQTTKMRFLDDAGRPYLFGMCVDVTELMESRNEEEKARRAYAEVSSSNAQYYNVARALSADYTSVYYVDLETDEYVVYRNGGEGERFAMDKWGKGFFTQGRDGALSLVYPADLEHFTTSFTRANILKTIDEDGVFTLTYRLLVDGEPTYVGMKITRIREDGDHLVMGVNNVDAAMRQQAELERIRHERALYARISALSGNYIAMYTVDLETSHYLEYSSDAAYNALNLKKEGEDFFGDSIAQSQGIIHADDIGMIRSLLTKENVLREIEQSGVFVLNYRLALGGVPTYVSLRAAIVDEKDGERLIVGVSNVDAQVKRDIEYAIAQIRASRDALTGVKNKHAYVDAEIRLDELIEQGESVEFAIVVCDINDLKLTNDTLGHQAGDELIRAACKLICNAFKHSPVYRVGGDEFCAILEGRDYEDADELLRTLDATNDEHQRTGEAVVAWGIARHRDHESVADVFSRADTDMYERKRRLKGQA